MKTPSRAPAAHQAFLSRFPGLGRAWELANEEGARGPLDRRTQRLIKLAIAVGAMREGAVHSGVRKARDAGVRLEAMEQVVGLAATTIGLPSAVAVWSWLREEAGDGGSGAKRPASRSGARRSRREAAAGSRRS